MARSQLKISVPKPCSESWSAMAPQAQGRFCASCATTVVDFSQFTDKQLLEYFTGKSGKTCGRFSVNQLNRPVYADFQAKQNFFPRAVAALALLLGISSQTQAQTYYNHPIPSGMVPVEDSAKTQEKTVAKTAEKVGEGFVISGKVIDKTTNTGLPGASVYLKGTKTGTATDVNGNFILHISDSLQLEEFFILTEYIGYENAEIKVLRKDFPITHNFVLATNSVTMGEVVVTSVKVSRLRSLWWRTKNLFRKEDY